MVDTLGTDPTVFWDWAQARRRCLVLATRSLRCRDDAEEAVQEALFRGWRHASSCRDPRNPVPWLMAITRRECARLARRRVGRAEVGGMVEAELERHGEQDDGHEMLETAAPAGDLRAAIMKLPEGERHLLELRYVSQLKQREIAGAVGLPEGTVKTKLHRIRARIRATMEAV